MPLPVPKDNEELADLYAKARHAGKALAEAEKKYLDAKRTLEQANAAYDKRQRELSS